jgi:hypothetical protein
MILIVIIRVYFIMKGGAYTSGVFGNRIGKTNVPEKEKGL